MLRRKKFQQLAERAKEVLEKRPLKKRTISYDDVYKLIDELDLCQVELELQYEDLQSALLELEESRHRYANLYDFIPFGYFTLNQHGRILEVNEAGANLIGIKKQKLIDSNLSRYMIANSQPIFNEHCNSTLNEMSLNTCEVKFLRKGGSSFYAQINSKAIANSITDEKYLLMFITDISNQKEQEEHLHSHKHKIASMDRTRSMGEFAEIISHELNHPLGVILNYLHGSIRRLEQGSFELKDIVHALKQASEQSQRVTEIILRMKNFTYKGTMNFELIDINDIIKVVISLIQYETLEFPINIHYLPIKNPPLLTVDKIHIEQVMVNIARNAIEAMRDAKVSEPRLIIEANQVTPNSIEICVIDNGPGVQSDTLPKLFSPYFTTKPYGVGLGLAVSRTIIEAHGSQLVVEANPFGGACFKFILTS
ncbi:MAG: PAS domain-containing sensor histidine kinase [Gammaproteobacteria bacterium]|nr:MAG: PAS domain-containing sensor histidine kinase [Gammaproteobacteria bacterium]